ncbi:PEP-CTERM sorting domain-containing protein [Paucibacter sp. B2R-40]|uniref:PEP-CTERM sorting domain-containing protein n=1 Tax=Paucibacter sp. B2R-40 TaxID=2893554 RepID=UPI0021E393A0|nr:PEP-CTERM sorting domain-containing protein [Paucibacter sp. B2R-40]MCV2355302.1 PEP-CTERM sorting domain-containing protein [Paucibacter sp. B2R-40]
MTISHSLSHRVALNAIVLAGAAGIYPVNVAAATFFNSYADVTATVSLGQGASWSGLGFAAGSNFLDASAQVATQGDAAYQISHVNQSVNREYAPPIPYDEVNLNGGIAPLIFKDKNGSLDYPCANASSSRGAASACATPSGSGLSFTMNSNITGEAFESIGYASAGVNWLANTFFKNMTADPLTVVWTVNYNLTARAHADHPPSDSALVETKLFAGIGAGLPCCDPKDAIAFNVAGDPPSDPPVSMVPVRPNPPPAIGKLRYEITLAPGATDQFSVHLTQFGVAEVAHLPEPATLWLGVAGLGVLAFAARRRVS